MQISRFDINEIWMVRAPFIPKTFQHYIDLTQYHLPGLIWLTGSNKVLAQQLYISTEAMREQYSRL